MSTGEELSPGMIQTTEDRLRSILEATTDWIWEMDLSGRHTYSNHRVETILGYSPDEFAALDFRELLHPDDRADVDARLPELIKRGEGWQGWSVRWRTKEGAYRTLESNAIPVTDAAGHVVGYRGVDRDVTDRLIAEQDRKYADRTLKAILSSSPDNILLLDRDARIRFINRTTPDLTIEEVMGRPAADFLEGDQKRIMLDCLERVRESAEPDHYEVTYATKDGKQRYFEARVFPVIRDGEVVSFVLNASDRTEQKQAQEALKASERLFSSLARAVPVGIFRCDPSGACVYSNEKCQEITGQTAEGMLGFGWARTLHENDRDRVVELWARAVRTRRPGSFECRFVSASHGTRWVFANTSPERDEDGNLTGFTGTITDVTARRQAEERLRHAQKLEAIGQLAGGIAHDFNNILAAILATAELIERVPDELDAGLDDIKDAVAQASALTKQLLSFGRKDLTKREVLDANELVRETETLLRRLLPEPVRLETRLAPGPLVVRVDRRQVEQVILNLAINARDAMEDGGLVTVSTYRATNDLGADVVGIAVEDEGSGIAPEVAERIFEPFFTTKPEGSGSGLGLATAYGIVTKHGGEIRFEPRRAGGTAFRVTFPAVAGVPELPAPSVATGPYRGSEVVLVCEDNAKLREATTRLLKQNGYRVVEARDGLDAVQTAATMPAPIDVILCDVMTPRLNGCDAAKRILARHPAAKTVLMSGHAADLLEGFRDLDSESACFLEKPFRGSDLLHTIRRLLDSPS